MNTIKSSYTSHGIHKFGNFAQTVENVRYNFFQEFYIGHIAPYYLHWKLYLKRVGNCYYPVVGVPNAPFNVMKVRISFFFNIITRNRELKDQYKIRNVAIVDIKDGVVGEPMDFHELLDPESGWLDKNGALVVQYGVRVEGIQRPGDPWQFNLEYPVFGEHTAVVRTRYRTHGKYWAPEQKTVCYAHAQMLAFHSTKFQKGQEFIVQLEKSDSMPLQVLHGVYEYWFWQFSSGVFQAARELGMDNLVLSMQQKFEQKRGYGWNGPHVQLACEMGLRSLLSQVLKRVKSEEELKTFLIGLEPERMAGESMKMMVAKVLYGKF